MGRADRDLAQSQCPGGSACHGTMCGAAGPAERRSSAPPDPAFRVAQRHERDAARSGRVCRIREDPKIKPDHRCGCAEPDVILQQQHERAASRGRDAAGLLYGCTPGPARSGERRAPQADDPDRSRNLWGFWPICCGGRKRPNWCSSKRGRFCLMRTGDRGSPVEDIGTPLPSGKRFCKDAPGCRSDFSRANSTRRRTSLRVLFAPSNPC